MVTRQSMRKPKTNSDINQLCPCGSGLKFIKCCGGALAKSSPLWQLEKLNKSFNKYNKLELVSILGGLQLCPENHSQLFRLETASRIVCKNKNKNNKQIKTKNLFYTLKAILPSNGIIGMQEDPPEGLFTYNIMFPNSNYTVYTGLQHIEPLVLQDLIHVVFHLKDEFPERFMAIIYFSVKSMLTISNEIAKRNGQDPYVSSPDRWRKNIKVPDIDRLHELSNTVIFTEKEIENLTSNHYDSIFPFILPLGHQKFKVEDPLKNPLFFSPLVKIDDKIVVALPGMVAGTLRHFILFQSQEFGVKNLLLRGLREKMWFDVNQCLDMMSFEHIPLDLPQWDKNISFEEGIFRIDNDKIAYVLLIMDDLTGYNLDEPYGTLDSSYHSQLASDRCEFIIKWLTGGNAPNCNEVLTIVIFGQLGRYGSIVIKKLPNNSRTILMTFEELKVIAETKECDNLTLWKFAETLKSFNHPLIGSFLDQYALYLDYHHSFNISDDVRPSSISISAEMSHDLGRAFRIKVANLWDTHAALHRNQPNVRVFRIDEDIPIYFYMVTGERLVYGYYQPIWVGMEDESIKKRELREKYWTITSTVSYWLWQLTPSLKSHLESLNLNPIHIALTLENPEKWIYVDLIDSTKIPVFEYNIDDFTIDLKIPSEIIKIVRKADNTADRMIIDELLSAFGSLLETHDLPNSLTKLERQRILDMHVPLGVKKHFLIYDSENISLNPQNIPKFRKLQEHDIEAELNELVDKLGDKAPPIGVIFDNDTKVKLCDDIVDLYYEKLKLVLRKFDGKLLLKKLIGSNEAICNKRASEKLKIAPLIGCYSDIPSMVKQTIGDFKEIEKIALTTRTLIEIIAAELPKGNQKISMDDMDKLLAITYHIINWGNLRDDINFELYNIDLKILKSGRIGVNVTEIIDMWDPFLKSKTLENVETDFDNFKLYYEPEYNSEEVIMDKIDFAFKDEFGLSLNQIHEFNTILLKIGLEQESPFACLLMSELKSRINKELGWDNKIIQTAIDIFSLKKRKLWEKPPEGFEKSDVWPWRFNRALSYLRRPLILISDPEDKPVVFWGLRHVDEAEKFLINLVMSGRYKTNKDTAEKMNTLVGKIRDKRGHKFTKKVKNWFEENTSFEIHAEIDIGPNEVLEYNTKLGDIDVLVIDRENKHIFSIECKHIFYGRNPSEIKNEIERFIGKKEGDNSWVNKHFKRHKWLNENINILSSAFELKSDNFQIFSIILTVREIPSTYLRKMILPFISFTNLKREGIDSLYDLLSLNYSNKRDNKINWKN
nr:SEC-C domain-containing protein [uncultured Methanobacterium sp.]